MSLSPIPDETFTDAEHRLRWSDRVDSILTGDAVATLGISTRSGGVLMMGVAPAGLRDRTAGTVTLTSSLGYWRKLRRMEEHPQVGLLYSDRSHGHASENLAVLIHGVSRIESRPQPDFLFDLHEHRISRFAGPPRRGPIWDRITYEYYWIRVRIEIEVRRLCAWEPGTGQIVEAVGGPWPEAEPVPSPSPAASEPKVSAKRAARRAQAHTTTALGYLGGDGYPVMRPVSVSGVAPQGLRLASSQPLPTGTRRAGMFSHRSGPQFAAMSCRRHSGWLHVDRAGAVFTPRTSNGFTVPPGKGIAVFGGSIKAKLGLRQARKSGLVDGDRWVGGGRRADEQASTKELRP